MRSRRGTASGGQPRGASDAHAAGTSRPPSSFQARPCILGGADERAGGHTLLLPRINVAPAQTPCHEKISLSFPEIRAAKNAPSFKVCATKKTSPHAPKPAPRGKRRPVPDPNPFRGQIHGASAMCAAGAGRPLPRCVQKTASKDVVRENAARSKTSHAHAQRSRAVRHPHAVAPKACSPLPEGACPAPCLCLPPSRRLRAPAALLLLTAALRKRRARLPNLSFQRRTNDERHNSRLSRAQRNALLPPFGDFSSQSGAVLRSEACTSGKRCPSCSPCPEKA